MPQYEELDALEIFKKLEERDQKFAELQRQYNAELNLLDEKYAKVLNEYRSARDEMNLKNKMFDVKWEPMIADYRKEIKSLRGKYKPKLKEL